jgi:3-dehydroquinate synthetase
MAFTDHCEIFASVSESFINSLVGDVVLHNPHQYFHNEQHHQNTTNIRLVNASKNASYPLHISYGSPKKCAAILKNWLAERKALIVTTPTVNFLYGQNLSKTLQDAGLNIVTRELACTEKSKSLSQVERICAWAQEADLGRRGILVSLGGGVCMDIVTVAASWIYRGIACIRVPTTLIGLVDAGIGIKGAINFGGTKNYLGCFSPPSKVLIAPFFLRTLPKMLLSEGFAEIIKMAIVCDPTLFVLIEEHGLALIDNRFQNFPAAAKEIIWRSIISMIDELESNIYENQTFERLVDFGHTFSPLLEVTSSHTLSHGQAVAVDIALSTAIAGELGLVDAVYRDRILNLMRSLRLPLWMPQLSLKLCRQAIKKAAVYRGGRPNLVLPTMDGCAYFLKDAAIIKDSMIARAIQRLAQVNA